MLSSASGHGWPAGLFVGVRDGAARAHTFLESTTLTSLVANGARALRRRVVRRSAALLDPELGETILQSNSQERTLLRGNKCQRGDRNLHVPFLRVVAPLHVEQGHVGT